MAMKVESIIELAKLLLKRVPKRIPDVFFANSNLADRTVVSELRAKIICWGRPNYLARYKLFALWRAIAQAALLYYLLIGVLFAGNNIEASFGRVLLGAVALATNMVFSVYLLFYFHRLAFTDILFENVHEVTKRQYRYLGFTAKLICIIQIIMAMLRAGAYMVNSAPHQSIIALLGGGLLLYIAFCVLYYTTCYFITLRSSFTVPLKNIENGLIQIHETSECHEVNLKNQFVVELSTGDLYVSPYTRAWNPDYDNTAKAYHISGNSITYIQLGSLTIRYDREVKKWVKYTVNSAVR